MSDIEHVPAVEHRDAFDYLGIEVSASLKEWGVVNDTVRELHDWLVERGVEPSGAPFYRIVRAGSQDDPFEVIVAFPVVADEPGDDRVRRYTMPDGTYATYLLTAWYDEIWKVHDSVNRWLEEEGRVLDKHGDAFVGLYEQYLTDPEVEPDPDKQQTLIVYKLTD